MLDLAQQQTTKTIELVADIISVNENTKSMKFYTKRNEFFIDFDTWPMLQDLLCHHYQVSKEKLNIIESSEFNINDENPVIAISHKDFLTIKNIFKIYNMKIILVTLEREAYSSRFTKMIVQFCDYMGYEYVPQLQVIKVKAYDFKQMGLTIMHFKEKVKEIPIFKMHYSTKKFKIDYEGFVRFGRLVAFCESSDYHLMVDLTSQIRWFNYLISSELNNIKLIGWHKMNT